MSSPASSSASAPTPGPPADGSYGPKVPIPKEHAARSMVFPKGSDYNQMWAALSGGGQAFVMAVGTPSHVVKLVVAQLFPGDGVADVTTADVLRLSAEHNLHPDQLRKLAIHLYKRWIDGHPFTTVSSAAVAVPSAALNAFENGRIVTTVSHAARVHFKKGVHRENISVNEEFKQADFGNYLYVPAVQPDPKQHRVVIVTYTSKFSDAAVAKFERILTDVTAIDAAWYRAMAEIMADRFAAKLVLGLCCEIVTLPLKKLAKGLTPVVFLAREKKLLRITFKQNWPLHFDGPSLVKELDKLDAAPHATPIQCLQCNIGNRVLRCAYCGELRYCNEACKDANWAAVHQAECRVYAKKMRGMPQPPGGPAVLKKA